MSKIGWWKLEDLTATIGSDLTAISTPDFSKAGKFNKGAYAAADAQGLKMLTPPSWTTSKGMIRFWAIPDFNLVDGVSGTGSFFEYIDWIATTNDGIYFAPTDIGGVGTVFQIQANGSATTCYCTDARMDWTAGDKVHIALIWDKAAGFDGSKTMAIYFNGAEVFSTTVALGTFSGTWTPHYILTDNGGSPAKSVIDNFIMDDNTNFDPTARLWEDEAGIPTGVTATQGTLAGKTTIDWSAVVMDGTGYKIYRADTSGGSYTEIDTSATNTYDDTTGVAGQHYFYKVTSYTSLAESTKSAYYEGWSQAAATTANVIITWF